MITFIKGVDEEGDMIVVPVFILEGRNRRSKIKKHGIKNYAQKYLQLSTLCNKISVQVNKSCIPDRM